MPEFTLYYIATVSKSITIEADDVYEAEEKAYDLLPSFPYHPEMDIGSDGWTMEDEYYEDDKRMDFRDLP